MTSSTPDNGIPVVTDASTCRHCERNIELIDGTWIDPEAPTDGLVDGVWQEGHPTDDAIWRETCDSHDTFVADHEPV